MAMPLNILFVLTDDQGPWALNCAGTPELDTPNLNRLANQGLRFTNFFCASPVCSPARASILTGTIPSAHGVHDWIRSGNLDKAEMDRLGIVNPYGGYADEDKPIQYLSGRRTFTDALAEQGYRCALSGKWHLGDSMTPQHGFCDWYTLGKGGACYYHPDMIEHGRIQVENRYITDLVTDKAVGWLEDMADGDSPFYLGVHYTAPHSPWEPEHHPADDIRRYADCTFASIPDLPDHPGLTTGPVFGTQRRRTNLVGYFAAVTAMDRAVGRLLDVLDRRSLWESTIVVFLSDNGMCMGHHGVWGKGNGTFPQNMYEESVKVPFLIACPQAAARAGQQVEDLASALDIYPTLLDLVGIADPQVRVLPGRSLQPLLSGQTDSHLNERPVVICEEYGPVRMLRTKRFKYVHRYPYGPHELYDLAEDPGETRNLIDEPSLQQTVAAMKRDLELWYRRYVDPDVDGSKEGVTGLGQLCRAGLFANRAKVYHTDRYKEKQP